MSGHVFVILCEIYQIITEIVFQMCFLMCCLDLKKWLRFPCIYLGLKGCLELKKMNGWMNEWINQSALTASNDQSPESVFNIMSFYHIAKQKLRGLNHWAMK